jgi:hypothetical protein
VSLTGAPELATMAKEGALVADTRTSLTAMQSDFGTQPWRLEMAAKAIDGAGFAVKRADEINRRVVNQPLRGNDVV